jgi:acyl-coenzyme A thioesterase PaaI-like protein
MNSQPTDQTTRLIAATRAVMLAAATTAAPPEQVEQARALLTEAAQLLGHRTRPRVARTPFDEQAAERTRAGQPWTMFALNPLGIPLSIRVDGTRASATLELGALHEGPQDLLHGGFAAAVLDALLGTLVHAQGLRAYTYRLDLRFLSTTPLDREVQIEGEVTQVVGRTATAHGWIAMQGTRTVEAKGVFVRPHD